ncbi:MAG TPA: lysophospholipid acyltransferase family protein [bacterium]|nr:lysophospholipid acyltransferase family protein [bacterium]
MRLLRAAAALPIQFVSAIILYSCVLIVAPFDPRREIVYHFGRAWLWLWVKLFGVRFAVEGAANVPAEGTGIFVANHTSYFDVPALYSHLPRPVRFLAMKSLLWVPIFGISLYALGHILVDQKDTPENQHKQIDQMRRLAEAGHFLAIYPDGGRARNRRIGPWKKGAFVLAIRAQIPIIPVGISGAARAHGVGDLLPRPGLITIRIGRPISTSGMTYEDRDRLLQMARAQVEELIVDD